MYARLFACRDRLVVIDDVDSLYANSRCVRLLKCLCQTDEEKRLAWHTAAAGLERDGIPRHFTTRSRLLIIANDWRNLNRNVAAVEDRGHLVSLRPPPEEVHAHAKTWFIDAEILQWFERHLSLFDKLSLRNYVRALELKRAGLDWIDASLPKPLPSRTRLVARLRDDASFKSEQQRVRAFVGMGAGCRATYFNHVRRLRAIQDSVGVNRRFDA
jgi:hypothetical protein